MPDTAPRERIGKALHYLGLLTLPLAVGAVLGFWLADFGVRWLPDMLELVAGWGLLGVLLTGAGRWLLGRAYKESDEGVVLRRRVLLLMGLGLLAVVVRLGIWWVKHDPSALTRMGPEQFEQAFAEDSMAYRSHEQELASLLVRLEGRDLPREGDDRPLSPEEEKELLESYVALRDALIALDRIREFWEDWYRWDPSRVERSYHLRSYLLTYAAELALVKSSARFVSRVMANDNARHFLDSPHPEVGLGPNTFSYLREQTLGSRDQARVLAGDGYLDVLKLGVKGRTEAEQLGVGWLWTDCREHYAAIEALGIIDRAALSLRADSQLLKRSVRRAWFPVQKEVAEVMGDTRVKRPGRYLIDNARAEELEKGLEPADILVSRKNWYLSNVGLPGFWPHGLLYLGPPDELTRWAQDPAILLWIKEKTGRELTFGQYMQLQHGRAWLDYQAGKHGHRHRVIEAISEGVVFNTWDHAAGDYLAAMKPNKGKLARAQAIDAAFALYGRPYDFDFDFATDHAVVCTELVWRAWHPAEGKEGLDIPLESVAGRLTLPANSLVRYYAEHAAEPEPPLRFGGFIDARDRQEETFLADEASLMASWQRPKWDMVQE